MRHGTSWEEISHKILEDINRGVTIIQGQGAYTGKEEKILYKVVNFREVSRLKQLIRGIDSKAFVVVAIHWRQWGTELETSPSGNAFQATFEILFGKMRDKPFTDLTGGNMGRQGRESNAKILFD